MDELRELNRRQAEFLAVTSHELRTPLTSIAGYAKTLTRDGLSDDPAARREFLLAIERQAGRLSTMIENVLAAAQLDGTEPTDTGGSVADAVAAALARLEPAGDRVVVDIATGLPDAALDQHLLELVLGNLIDNALKFSPDGAPCRAEAFVEENSLVIRVEDEGIGIAEEHRARIFERFYQVDSSSTRRFGGVGLGLHLVKQVVERGGGSIHVQDGRRAGTRFNLRIPLRGEPVPAITNGSHPSGVQAGSGGPRRVRPARSSGSAARGARLGDPRDLLDGPSHGIVPPPGHQVSPPASKGPEVGAELALIAEERALLVLGQLEPFGHVRNGSADQAEVDRRRTFEPNRLDGDRFEPWADRRSMGRQHHLLRALEDLDLLGDRRGRRSEVRRGDHLEDEIARRLDAYVDRPQRPDRAPDGKVEDDVARDESPIDPAAGRHGEHHGCSAPPSRAQTGGGSFVVDIVRPDPVDVRIRRATIGA